MIFKDAFEHYKSGAATPEETDFVEQELEKSQLIAEYLEDELSLEPSIAEDPLEHRHLPEDPAEILARVRKSIRKRSRNIVLISVAIIAVLALLTIYAAIPMLNKLYYNPMTRETDEFAYDFDFPLIAYTELHQPGLYYSNTDIQKTGIGTYNLTLVRYSFTDGEQEYVSASLSKNHLQVPLTFTSGNLSMNIFARASTPVYDLDSETKALFISELKQLPDYQSVTAAVSFSEDFTMDQLIEMMDNSKLTFLWAGIRNAPEDTQCYPLCGIDLTGSGPVYETINKKYPEFELSAGPINRKHMSSDYEQHFISLLQYTIDHPYFVKELNANSNYDYYYPAVLDYVKQNGLKTYGVMVKGSAKDILALMDSGKVSQIWPINAVVSF